MKRTPDDLHAALVAYNDAAKAYERRKNVLTVDAIELTRTRLERMQAKYSAVIRYVRTDRGVAIAILDSWN